MTVGEIIFNRRKELGLTLEEIGKATGVSKSTVKKWENGYIKKISYADIKLLAEVLEVPVSYFDVELCSPQIEEQPKGTIMTMGDRVKKLRTEKGMTQGELAEAIGTTKQNIYKYETGIISNIPMDRIKAIAKHLNVSPNYLMGWAQIEEQPNGIMSTIDNIFLLLKKQKKTQKDLTDYLGIEKSVSSQWKNGKSLSYMKYIDKIAEFLDTSPSEILERPHYGQRLIDARSTKGTKKVPVRKIRLKKSRPKKKDPAPLRRSRKEILERLKSYRPAKPEVRKEEETAMKEDLSSYVRELGRSLMSYSRNNVYRIIYISNDKGEFAEISFTDGSKKLVNITGDSCLAATLDITKALI